MMMILHSFALFVVFAPFVIRTSPLLRLRNGLSQSRRQPALQAGTMQLLPAHDQLLAYIRESREPAQRLLCAFNCSAQAMRWKLPAGFEAMAQAPCRGADLIDGTVHLEPWGVLLAHARGEHEHAVHEGAGKSSYLGR